jgi:hypothetical protein
MLELLLAWSLAPPDRLQVPTPRVAAERAVIVDTTANPPVVEFDIVNDTNVAVTAWKVGITVRHANGPAERVATATDAHVAFAGVIPDSTGAVAHPHSTIRGSVTINNAGPDVLDVSAALIYAIFADGTWTGDPKDVDELFARRNANYQDLTEIITDLRAARASASGAPALRDALDRLNRHEQSGGTSALKEVMRRNIQAALKSPNKAGAPPEELLAQWILRSEARLQATEAHRHKGAQAVVR